MLTCAGSGLGAATRRFNRRPRNPVHVAQKRLEHEGAPQWPTVVTATALVILHHPSQGTLLKVSGFHESTVQHIVSDTLAQGAAKPTFDWYGEALLERYKISCDSLDSIAFFVRTSPPCRASSKM